MVALDGRQHRPRRHRAGPDVASSDAGVRGVQLFDGGMGVPLVVPEPVRPGSDAWTRRSTRPCAQRMSWAWSWPSRHHRGGAPPAGPGCGPADAMKKVVWAEVLVGRRTPRRQISLPPLPSVAGLYQDMPALGRIRMQQASQPTGSCSRSPTTDPRTTCSPAAVTASVPIEDWRASSTARSAESLSLPRNPDAWSTRVDRAALRRARDGVGPWSRDCRDHAASGRPPHPTRCCRSATMDRTTARSSPGSRRRFPRVRRASHRSRQDGSGWCSPGAVPPRRCLRRLAAGVRLPPVLRRADAFLISEFALRTGGRVHHAETKAGFGVVPDYFAVDTDPSADAGSDRPAGGDRPHAAHRRRRAPLGCAARALAHPAPRRIAHRADQRPRPGRFDRPRGRQARRSARRGLPRDASRHGSATGGCRRAARGSPRF